MSDSTQYAYAVARIRAIEKKLLDKTKFERMIDAKTSDEAAKILLEADYGSSSLESVEANDYENMLEEETKKVYTLLKDIAPEPKNFDLFLFKNDYHNLKVILKNEFMNVDEGGSFLDHGTIPLNKMKVMIKERKMADMTVVMRKAVEECIDVFNRSNDPQAIDIILDRATFQQMLEVSKKIENPFLEELTIILIDLANINTFLRVKSMKKSWDFLTKVLLLGGRIDHNVYIRHLQDSVESFISGLMYTRYSSIIEEGIGAFIATGSLTRFEKLSDNYIMEYVKKAKYISLGIEPLIGFLVAKETEIKNIRIVMVGKTNNISGEIIRERLREAYV